MLTLVLILHKVNIQKMIECMSWISSTLGKRYKQSIQGQIINRMQKAKEIAIKNIKKKVMKTLNSQRMLQFVILNMKI